MVKPRFLGPTSYFWCGNLTFQSIPRPIRKPANIFLSYSRYNRIFSRDSSLARIVTSASASVPSAPASLARIPGASIKYEFITQFSQAHANEFHQFHQRIHCRMVPHDVCCFVSAEAAPAGGVRLAPRPSLVRKPWDRKNMGGFQGVLSNKHRD